MDPTNSPADIMSAHPHTFTHLLPDCHIAPQTMVKGDDQQLQSSPSADAGKLRSGCTDAQTYQTNEKTTWNHSVFRVSAPLPQRQFRSDISLLHTTEIKPRQDSAFP